MSLKHGLFVNDKKPKKKNAAGFVCGRLAWHAESDIYKLLLCKSYLLAINPALPFL